MVSTKAACSEYSGLFELKANAGAGQKDQQIGGVISLRALRSKKETAPPQGSRRLCWIACESELRNLGRYGPTARTKLAEPARGICTVASPLPSVVTSVPPPPPKITVRGTRVPGGVKSRVGEEKN